MEVRIRLQRIGKAVKGARNYRIVAISKATKRDGRDLEILGHYDSKKQPAIFKIDHAKLDKWLAKGAQMSDTVKSLVKKDKKK